MDRKSQAALTGRRVTPVPPKVIDRAYWMRKIHKAILAVEGAKSRTAAAPASLTVAVSRRVCGAIIGRGSGGRVAG